MSETDDCIRRLSKMYQDGTLSIQYPELFPNTNLTPNQIQSIIATLEAKQIIKASYLPRYEYSRDEIITPNQIQILPGVIDAELKLIDAESKVVIPYSWDDLWRRFKSKPIFSLPSFVISVTIIILTILYFIWPELAPKQ